MLSKRLMALLLCVISLTMAGCSFVYVRSNGLAKTPPMGWSSWNSFSDRIDDATVRAMADAMVSSGMRDAGYVYLNIDDTWEGSRDAQGNLQGNSRFPDMKALADYVHSKGLKFGLYSSPGPTTCSGYTGSYGHEQQDAETFSEWGVDYLKYDWCSADQVYSSGQMESVYSKMGWELEATGRPIVFSLSDYGDNGVEQWGRNTSANLWRTTDDIRDSWDSMISNIETDEQYASNAGPGHWNDPDMLEIGNGQLSDAECRVQLSLWALSAAPLIASNDIRSMSAATASILLNQEVIAIDQDPLGKQSLVQRSGSLETWVKPLADGSVAVGLLNRDSSPGLATVNGNQLDLKGSSLTARDVWAHQNIPFVGGQLSATVPGHGILLLRLAAN